MKPVAIIDCDPGHDDVMAILLAGRTLDLRAITTVHGNASLANTTTNARKTVEFAGLDVPIAAGMPRPLVREPHYAPDVHGESGLDGPDLPVPTVAILEQHAVDVILERSHSVPDLHLVPVGPLTNVASALVRDPIGRAGLLADLENEMIAYTPEELLAIAAQNVRITFRPDSPSVATST